jgi:hypothetical protein
MKFKLRLDKQFTVEPNEDIKNTKFRQLFIGWKNSLEALSRYDLYVNSNGIYSQTWVGQESFIFNAGLCQTIKEKCPYVYTCYDNACSLSPDVCGVYVDLSDYNPETPIEFDIDIPIKINLHQILLLTSVRYLPSFCGRWELELYPNWNNLVVLPVSPYSLATIEEWGLMEKDEYGSDGDDDASNASTPTTGGTPIVSSTPKRNLRGFRLGAPAKAKLVTQDFTQIGEQFTMMEAWDGASATLLEDIKLSCVEGIWINA